jgi:hypothetical protein
MKREFQSGIGARKNFEETMKKLFRVPKSSVQRRSKTPKSKASAPEEK